MISKTIITAALLSAAVPGQALADSFWDGFDNNSFNTNIWTAESGKNGDPFGCTFYPDMFKPDTGGNVALTMHNGACSELKSKAQYLYGTAQTRMAFSNVPGTVASLFSYNSWYDNPGNPWTEIDIEFLPSFGNTLHTNIIYQASPTSAFRQWEKYVNLDAYGINPTVAPVHVGFDWTDTAVSWYVIDSSNRKVYIRTARKSDATNCDCVPVASWPSRPARLFANFWHGNNYNYESVNYFPKRYNFASGRAVYDWIQFIDY